MCMPSRSSLCVNIPEGIDGAPESGPDRDSPESDRADRLFLFFRGLPSVPLVDGLLARGHRRLCGVQRAEDDRQGERRRDRHHRRW